MRRAAVSHGLWWGVSASYSKACCDDGIRAIATLSSGDRTMDDELLYQNVADEIRIHGLKEGLWLKALHLADGDPTLARTKYIGLRVEQLKTEARTLRFVRNVEKAKRKLEEANSTLRRTGSEIRRSIDESPDEAGHGELVLVLIIGVCATLAGGLLMLMDPSPVWIILLLLGIIFSLVSGFKLAELGHTPTE